jgi:hypothetical protein
MSRLLRHRILTTISLFLSASSPLLAQSFQPLSPYVGAQFNLSFQPSKAVTSKFQMGVGLLQTRYSFTQNYSSFYTVTPQKRISYLFDAGFDDKIFLNVNGENVSSLKERFLRADEGGRGGLVLGILGGVAVVGGIAVISANAAADAAADVGDCVVQILFGQTMCMPRQKSF